MFSRAKTDTASASPEALRASSRKPAVAVERSARNFSPRRRSSGLEKVRRERSVVLHHVSLAIGSVDPSMRPAPRLRELASASAGVRLGPPLLGRHSGRTFTTCMPLRHRGSARALVSRVKQSRRCSAVNPLENVSSYVEYARPP